MIGNRRLFAGLLALALLCCGRGAPARAAERDNVDDTPYVGTVYNERNGLPTGEANAVVQTSDGYVWIGSYAGLIRYDGSTFYPYAAEGDIVISSVRALYEDSRGRLWVGTNDAGVIYIEDGELYRAENPNPKSFLCVRGFAEGPDGVIYVASNSGMAEIRDGVLTPYTDDSISGGTVYTVSVDSQGRVWGALNSGMCAVVENGRLLRLFSSGDFFDHLEIYCTAADKIGRIYLGTSGSEMVRLTFPSDSLDPEDFEIDRFETPHVSTHNAIIPVSDGRVIVCGTVGACVFTPEGMELPFTAEEGASSVNSACADYEGNIWLASSSTGVTKFTRGYFRTPNAIADLDGVAISAIVRQQGRSYLGTNTGLLAFDEDWQPLDNALTRLFAGTRIRSLLADSRGNVWVAAYSGQNPVVCYDPETDTPLIFTVESGLVNTSARSLLELSDGGIVVGTQGGLNIIRDGAVVAGYTAEDGLEIGSMLCLLESPTGSLLLGSDGGGVYEIDGGQVVNHFHEEGLSDGVVLRMLRDSDGAGIFVSAGSSLYYWDESGFRLLPIRKSAGSIFDFFLRDGMLWILQNNGVLAFDRAQLVAGANPSPREYSFAHGLTGSIDANTWNWLDPDGSLYVATRSGVSVFGFESVIGTLPMGIISGAHIGPTVINHPEHLQLESDVSRVTIDFAVLSFAETSDVGFIYTLEGFDEAETVVTGQKSGSVSYTNLPGGEYTFRLRVFMSENPELFNDYALTIAKEPKFWELLYVRVLAVALLVIVVALGVALIYRSKIRGIQRRQGAYRHIIDQSLQTFARTIDAKDSYTIGHSLRVAKYASELARRMGRSPEEQENIYCVALLHDIGKVGVPDEILTKAEELTPEEQAVMQQHVIIGADVLRNFTALRNVSDAAKYHHERYDGQGYCEHLAGADIPLVARIIAVADAYDTMSGDRRYRRGLPKSLVADELRRGSGTQFDPEIVPHMLNMMADGFAPVSLDSDAEDTVSFGI